MNINKLLSTLNIVLRIPKKFKSSLYITGEKAQHMFVALSPYIDFDKKLVAKTELLKNIRRRALDIDLEKLSERYQFFKAIREKKAILEENRKELNTLFVKLSESSDISTDQINQLKLHKYVVSEELKCLKEYLYDLEESVMLSILDLPNGLHPLTPDKDEIIHEFLQKPTVDSQTHIDIGLKLNVIKLVEDVGCYLKSNASLFEISVSNYFIDKFQASNFIQFQNADFTRSIIVEGCGTDVVNNSKLLSIFEPHSKNNVLQELCRLHLTGSASIYSFMAYFCKHIVQTSHLPLKCFCFGRSYNGDLRKNDSLFNLNQESTLCVFIATLENTHMEILGEIVENIKEIYDNLGFHYRLLYVKSDSLKRNESWKLSIQMFSNNLQQYIEVGYVGYYDSYVSERLLFTATQGNERIFPKIFSGPVLNVQKMLGCVLENKISKGCSIMNDILKGYLP